jgi:hypothetical protein
LGQSSPSLLNSNSGGLGGGLNRSPRNASMTALRTERTLEGRGVRREQTFRFIRQGAGSGGSGALKFSAHRRALPLFLSSDYSFTHLKFFPQ